MSIIYKTDTGIYGINYDTTNTNFCGTPVRKLGIVLSKEKLDKIKLATFEEVQIILKGYLSEKG